MEWLERSITETNVNSKAEYNENLGVANAFYDGSRPDIASLTGFIEELNNDIKRNTAAFRKQIVGSAENGTMDTFYRAGDKIVLLQNPGRQAEAKTRSQITGNV